MGEGILSKSFVSLQAGVLGIFLLLIGGVQAAERPSQILSLQQKREWIDRLDQCRSGCANLARGMIVQYAAKYPDSFMSLRSDAKTTLVYLHCYSLNPRNPNDSVKLLENEAAQGGLNIIAPVFTAHQWDSTPEDFKNATPTDWSLDAELGLRMGAALGKPVVIYGFSLGALFGADVAIRFPQLVDRLVLNSPAVMIRDGVDNLACLGESSVLQWIVTTADSSHDPVYLEKFMNGACTLAQSILQIRQDFAPELSDPFDQTRAWARLIHAKTVVIHSESDDALDLDALDEFSRSVPGARRIVYPRSMGIAHLSAIFDHRAPDQTESTYQIIDDFIRRP